MTKCHVRELKQVWSAILRDAHRAYPTLGSEFERDLARLLRVVERRGIHLFTVDLPSVAKHFDKCLAAGQYSPSGLPLTKRVSGGVVVPKFLRELYLLVFDNHGCLREDYDIEAIFFIRQLLLVGKKTALSCSRQAVVDEVDNFLTVDTSLPVPHRDWVESRLPSAKFAELFPGFSRESRYAKRTEDLEPPIREQMSTFLSVLDDISKIVSSTLGLYRPGDWKFKHGPGAVSDGSGALNKYCWVNWSERLEAVFAIADCGFHNHASWQRRIDTSHDLGISSKEPTSKLVDVPKTILKPRLIAAEPREHQWCQQNLWHYFRTRVQNSWISNFVRFTDQTRNQELCLRGSFDGSLATVDLSAASDRVTCQFVGNLFGSNASLLGALRASRTCGVRQTQANQWPPTCELRKFSTMGSACTFPVQSLGFLCIALASVYVTRKLGRKVTLKKLRAMSGEVTIFGDDIIIPVDSRELMFGALEVLDFKVNTDKSFWTGKFRESCGVDSFAGVNVTPAYWKAPYTGDPESLASTVAVTNNFHQKWLLETVQYLASTIRRGPIRVPLVGMGSGVCGLKSFVSPPISVKTRWNKDLQKMEALVPVLISTAKRLRTTDDTAVLQYFTEAPEPHIKWEQGIPLRAKLKTRLRWVGTECLV